MVVVRKMVLGYRLIFKSAACTISDLIEKMQKSRFKRAAPGVYPNQICCLEQAVRYLIHYGYRKSPKQ
jgi:hypothetical protein